MSKTRNNSLNHKLRKDNTSEVNGVYWREDKKRWVAQIRVNGVGEHLGSFRKDEKGKAEGARKAADKKYGFHENHGQ